MLQIQNYSKVYNDQLILRIEQLKLECKIYWVKGPNGIGKTTFFKSISGLIPSSGDFSIDAVSLSKSPREYRSLIHYAEAEPIFPSFLTGQELLEFHISSRQADTKATSDLVKYFNIEHFLPNQVGTYSSGMLKKLSILLALIGQPKYILLDEPLVTVEDSFLPLLYTLIRKMNSEMGIGFLISSHQALDLTLLPIYHTLKVGQQTIICED